MLRFLTAGESHGQALLAIVEGVPAGLRITEQFIAAHLARRQRGYGRGGRMAIEHDQAQLVAGVRFSKTIGSPIAVLIKNRDWESWKLAMDVEKAPPESEARRVTVPRPGHADLAGAAKYAADDMRDVLERASARETAARVAVGSIARRLLEEMGIEILSHVLTIGRVRAQVPGIAWGEIGRRADASDVRCADAQAAARMRKAIDVARRKGDTVGGIFQIAALGVPPGLGSYAQWDRRLDGRLARALMSIPGVKGVEVGLGFGAAALPGSQVHDEMMRKPAGSADEFPPWRRPTNRAGGLEGGVSTGEPILLQAAMKPIATLMRPLRSLDLSTGRGARAHVERADVCAVPAASVVGEAVVAIELACAALEKFGGDSMQELLRNLRAFRRQVARQFARG
jgi:chorismate synthase